MLSERRTKLSLVFEVVKIQEIQEIEANKLRNGVLLIKTIGMQKGARLATQAVYDEVVDILIGE